MEELFSIDSKRKLYTILLFPLDHTLNDHES
jgi:hypothetical protein